MGSRNTSVNVPRYCPEESNEWRRNYIESRYERQKRERQEKVRDALRRKLYSSEEEKRIFEAKYKRKLVLKTQEYKQRRDSILDDDEFVDEIDIIRNPDNKFDDFIIENGTIILLVGPSERGKSTLVKYLAIRLMKDANLEEKYRFDDCYVFTGTEYNGFYQEFLPLDRIRGKYTTEELNEIYEDQVKAKNLRIPLKRILVIIEDSIGSLSSRDTRFNEVIQNMRHVGMTVIISIQHMSNYITKDARQKADYVFLWRTNIISVMKDYHGHFCKNHLGTYKQFVRMFYNMTYDNKYQSLLYVKDDNEPYHSYLAPDPEFLEGIELISSY